MISLIVPAFNEEERLPASLASLRSFLDQAGEDYEVIVVDDCSTDRTCSVVEAAARDWPQLSLLRSDVNGGKGAALSKGMLAAHGEHRAFSDADMSTPISELPRLRERLVGNCTVAIASRALPESRVLVEQPRRRVMMGRVYNRLLQLAALPGLHDTQCGFKVFTAEAANVCFSDLRSKRFGFDAEVLVKALNQGWEIAEVPVEWANDDATRVSAVRDSAQMLVELYHLRKLRRRGTWS